VANWTLNPNQKMLNAIIKTWQIVMRSVNSFGSPPWLLNILYYEMIWNILQWSNIGYASYDET
jgi:hypothetical protein